MHRHKTVTVNLSDTTLTVDLGDGDVRVVRRTNSQPVRSIKASGRGAQLPPPDDQCIMTGGQEDMVCSGCCGQRSIRPPTDTMPPTSATPSVWLPYRGCSGRKARRCRLKSDGGWTG